MSGRFTLCVGVGLMAFASLMPGQTVTGSLSGTVLDSGGAVVAGAQVQLINSISRQARDFTSNSAGDFEFTGMIPGSYRVKVSHAGFKTYEQQNVTISAQERVDLHTIRMTVG